MGQWVFWHGVGGGPKVWCMIKCALVRAVCRTKAMIGAGPAGPAVVVGWFVLGPAGQSMLLAYACAVQPVELLSRRTVSHDKVHNVSCEQLHTLVWYPGLCAADCGSDCCCWQLNHRQAIALSKLCCESTCSLILLSL